MTLKDYFLNNDGRNMIHKPMSYFDIYERYFSRFRGEKITVLEIGVENGGSLQMWKEYFGDKANIVGIDINPKCKEFESKGISVYIGDQANRDFLYDVALKEGGFDIVIDDGGHHSKQQYLSFSHLYQVTRGIYLVEDIGCSYRPEYGGGYLHPASFIEFSKSKIDELMAHSNQLQATYFTDNTAAIHFHDCIIVFEKGKRQDHNTQAIGERKI